MLSLITFSALALSVEHRLDHTKLGIHDNGDGIVHLMLPGVATSPWIGEDGEPALPVQRTSYALAVKEGSAALRITNAVYEEVALGARQMLAPAQHSFRCGGPTNATHVPMKMGAYETHVFNRSAPAATLSAPAVLRDIAYQVLTVIPVQYDHARRTLCVLTSATIELTGVAEAGMNGMPVRVTRSFAELYRASFANSDALVLDASAPETALLIHDENLAQEAATMKAHKEQVQGVPTTLVPASQVGKTATQFKAYIESQFEATKMAHVLLLGSIEAIPSPFGLQSKASCDNCYAFITEDYAIDFFVSRITGDAAAAQVDKIQHYETTPGVKSFVGDAWGIASDQTDAPKPTPAHPTDCTRVTKYKETLLGWHYKADTVECDPYATTKQGLQDLIDAFDAGKSLVNYLGHGAGHYWVMTHFDIDDAHNLTNRYTNPIILDGSCNCGDFGHTTSPFHTGEKKCLAEALMEGNPNVPGSGAIAMFSSAPTAQWVPPADMETGALAALTGGKVTRVGPLMYAGIQYMLTQWPNQDGDYTIEGYNLFGDSLMSLKNLPVNATGA